MRIADESDVAALVALINAAFAVERPIFGGDRIDHQGVLAYMKKGTFLVTEAGGGLVGCVYGELRGETGYVGLLSVEPLREGTGLGRKLMEAVEEFFRNARCKRVELRVVSARASLPTFYRHLGYMETRIEEVPPEIKTNMPCYFQYMTKSID